MIPTWKAFFAFCFTQLCVALLGWKVLLIIEKSGETTKALLAGSLVVFFGGVSAPLGLYIVGKVGEMGARALDKSTMAEQITAESEAKKG